MNELHTNTEKTFKANPASIYSPYQPPEEAYEVHYVFYVTASNPATALQKTANIHPDEYVVTKSE